MDDKEPTPGQSPRPSESGESGGGGAEEEKRKKRPDRKDEEKKARAETGAARERPVKAVDPELNERRKLLDELFKRAKERGVVSKDAEARLKSFIEALEKLEQGETLSAREEVLMRSGYGMILKDFAEDFQRMFKEGGGEFADIFAAAKGAGAKDVRDTFEWMFKAELIEPEKQAQRQRREGRGKGGEEPTEAKEPIEIKSGSGEETSQEKPTRPKELREQDVEAILESVEAPEPGIGSKLVLAALEIADPQVKSQGLELVWRLHEQRNKLGEAEPDKEKITFMQLMLALLKLLWRYIKQVAKEITEFEEASDEELLGTFVSAEKLTTSQREELVEAGVLPKEAGVEARSARELDPEGGKRKSLLTEALRRIEERRTFSEEGQREFQELLELLGRRERGELSPEEEQDFQQRMAAARFDFRGDVYEIFHEGSEEFAALFAGARAAEAGGLESLWNWLFQEGAAPGEEVGAAEEVAREGEAAPGEAGPPGEPPEAPGPPEAEEPEPEISPRAFLDWMARSLESQEEIRKKISELVEPEKREEFSRRWDALRRLAASVSRERFSELERTFVKDLGGRLRGLEVTLADLRNREVEEEEKPEAERRERIFTEDEKAALRAIEAEFEGRYESWIEIAKPLYEHFKERRVSFFGPKYDKYKEELDTKIKPIISRLKYEDDIEAEDIVDDFFDRMISEAETDSRQPWDLGGVQHVLDEFEGLLEKVSRTRRDEYVERWIARRHYHYLNMLIETGAELEALQQNSKRFGRSTDKDKLGRSVRGLEAALPLLEQQLKVVKQDPRNKGHIPLWMLELGEGGRRMVDGKVRNTIAGEVAERLLEMSDAGLLRYRGMNNQEREIRLESRDKALEVAEMAIKILSADMRVSEHYEETPVPEAEAPEPLLRSPFADGIAKAMNPVKELVRRFGTMGESVEVINELVEQMDTNAQDGIMTRTDQNKIFGRTLVTRLSEFTSIWSNWRGLKQATERLRKMGLGLGLDIYHANTKARIARERDPVKEQEEKGEQAKLWVEAAKRNPSVIANFFPGLSWKWKSVPGGPTKARRGEQELYEGRWTRKQGTEYMDLRDGVVRDGEGLKQYARLRAETSKVVEAFEGDWVSGPTAKSRERKMRDEIKLGPLKIMGEKKEPIYTKTQAEGRVERRRQLEIVKQEQQRAFVWMLGENLGDDNGNVKDAEGKLIHRPDKDPKIDSNDLEAWDRWEKAVFERWNETRKNLLTVERRAFLEYRRRAEALEKQLERTFDKDDPAFKEQPEFKKMQDEFNILDAVEKLQVEKKVNDLKDEELASKLRDRGLIAEEVKIDNESRNEMRRRLRGAHYIEKTIDGFDDEELVRKLELEPSEISAENREELRGQLRSNLWEETRRIDRLEDKELAQEVGIKKEEISEDNRERLKRRLIEKKWEEVAADWKFHAAVEFDEHDVEVVRRLTYMGGENDQERRERAEHLSEQDLVMVPFLEDVDFSLTEFAKTGGDAVPARRYNDGLDATKAGFQMNEILSNLGSYEDKLRILGTNEKLIEDLTKYRNLPTHISMESRQEHTRVWATLMVKDFFRADDWVEGGDGIGAILPWRGPWGFFKDFRFPFIGRLAASSSVAQRRLGPEALSWTTGERYRFIQKLAAHIGPEEAKKMEELLGARGRDVIKGYTKQLLLPGLAFGAGYVGVSWGSGLLKLSYETLKQWIQEAAQAA